MSDLKLLNCSVPANYLTKNMSDLRFIGQRSSTEVNPSVGMSTLTLVILTVLINIVLHYSVSLITTVHDFNKRTITNFTNFNNCDKTVPNLFQYCKRHAVTRLRTRLLNKKTLLRTITLLVLLLCLPIIIMILGLAFCYKVLCTLVIWKKDKHFVGLLDSFDVFWSLEDEATINVLGVIESDSPEDLVESIKHKLHSVISKAGVDKIFYRRCEEYGFYYWRRNSSVDISKYVEVFDFPDKCKLNDKDLEDIMAEVSYHSLPYDNEGLFKIFVTKQRVGNYSDKRGQYGIIFIIHHSVGDGVALLEFLCKMFADKGESNVVNMFSVPDSKNYESPRALFEMINKLWEMPLCFVDLILRKPDDNVLHGPTLFGEKTFKWTKSDENLLLMVKELKESMGNVTFSDVLATALSGGMHDYFTKTKAHVPEDLGVILPVRLPKPPPIRNDHLSLKNDFSVTILELPIGDKRSIIDIKRRCDELRISADPLSNHYFIKLVGIFPKAILQPALKSGQATMVFSSMPGPEALTICGGNALKELVFFVPHKGNTGLDVTALCYGGVLRLAASADKSLVSDPEHLSYILDGMVEEIRRLHRQYV